MKPPFLLPSNHSTPALPFIHTRNLTSPILNSSPNSTLFLKSRYFPLYSFNRCNLLKLYSSNSSAELLNSDSITEQSYQFVEIANPNVTPFLYSWRSKFSLSDQASFLFTFIACTASVAFISLVAAAVPTLFAMGRAANSFAKLADTAREELPSTMAAIRLSGMEISDLTVELSDLSQEISEGVNKSVQAVQAAKLGMKQIGSLAHEQTMSMIEERASLPVISLQPVVSGAAKKTSHAVGHATKTLMKFISGVRSTSEENDDLIDSSMLETKSS